MSAYFSADRAYRYSLTREVAPLTGEGTVAFVGLNPSTADETLDDPTIRRCIGFARSWGFARLKMVNLYAFRATDPKVMLAVEDPVGPDNDHVLSLVFGGSELVIAAWGVNAKADRLTSFAETFRGWPLHCLGVTKDGFPRHPLYVRGDTTPQPFGDLHPVAHWTAA